MTEQSTDRPLPTRRTVAKGAAWSVPVLATAATAPAFAASPCGTCPTIAFGTAWSAASTSPSTAVWTNANNQVGFVSSDPLGGGVAGTYFGVGKEPSTAQSISTTLTNVTLAAGCSYVVNSVLSTWEGSQIAATLTMLVGTQTVLTYTTATGTGGGQRVKSGSTFTSSAFTVPSTSAYTITLQVSFPGAPSVGENAGDIWFRSPTLTCTAG